MARRPSSRTNKRPTAKLFKRAVTISGSFITSFLMLRVGPDLSDR